MSSFRFWSRLLFASCVIINLAPSLLPCLLSFLPPPTRAAYCEKRASKAKTNRKTNRKKNRQIEPFPSQQLVLWANTVRPNVPTNSYFLFYFFVSVIPTQVIRFSPFVSLLPELFRDGRQVKLKAEFYIFGSVSISRFYLAFAIFGLNGPEIAFFTFKNDIF